MKTKSQPQADRAKLALRKQTLRALSGIDLQQVAGGALSRSRYCGSENETK